MKISLFLAVKNVAKRKKRILNGRNVFGLLVTLISVCLSSPVIAHDFMISGMKILHPYIATPPPGARAVAGYLEISNPTQIDDRLIGVASDIADKVEIHETKMENSMMIMRELDKGLSVPAGGEVALTPGKIHVMFIGLKEDLVEGERYSATLLFEKAGELELQFAVEKMKLEKEMDHSTMDHSK